MNVLLVLIGVTFLLLFGAVFLVLFFLARNPATAPAKSTETVSLFRWRYVVLPLALLLLAIGTVAWFSGRLPAEVAYHFTRDGAPDAWTKPGTLVLWTLLPQCLLTLLALCLTWGLTKTSGLWRSREDAGAAFKSILLLMGNMIALPQLILLFAMLSAFAYNVYQIRFPPLWLFALVVMGVGAVVLGVFFIRMMQSAREVSSGQSESDET